MGTVNNRNDLLYLDFRYKNTRCREYTKLPNTGPNRKRLRMLMDRIEAEITLGTFEYSKYFPNSKFAKRFYTSAQTENNPQTNLGELFSDFSETWFSEKEAEWRNSHRSNQRLTLDKYLLPTFGDKPLIAITKPDILKFRSDLVKQNGLKGRKLSASRINHIMTPLRMILNEAADRYEFATPFRNIKPLKVPRTDVEPFTLEEVWKIINTVRSDFRSYYTVRFFTALRTVEIDGLKWQYVDFDRRQILIREASVEGELVEVKTDGSWREIDMSAPVYEALKEQHLITGNQEYVFCNSVGNPLRHNDITKNVWYPLLRLLGLKKRRPYQTRHTAATLWLAAGESPEWIARQMGHSTTEMLFRVYSRFVPNLTRQDGSAFENFLFTRNYEEN